MSRALDIVTRRLQAVGGFLRRRFWVVPLLAAAFLAALAWAVLATVAGAIEERLGEELTTILNADVAALQQWLKRQKAEAESLAAAPAVRDAVRGLVKSAESTAQPRTTLLATGELKDLRSHLQPAVQALGYEGFAVVSPALLIVAADHDDLVGLPRAANRTEFFESVLKQDLPAVSRPFPSILKLPGPDGERREGVPIMLAAAPVRDRGKVVAVLSLRIRPEKEFSDILRTANYGKTGETYAFDNTGLLLSQSRFDPQLKQIGLLPDRPDAQSILAVELRDPGVNLLEGQRPALPRGEQPLTRMAEVAVTGVSGVNTKGYRDYRGVRVVGAWTWLAEQGFGVATEVDATEAYEPLSILQGLFGGLFVLLALATAGLLVLGLVVARQGRQMRTIRAVGPYTLGDKIGEGGMGVVYRARHALLRRPTAVKLLNSASANERAVARFEREVQLTAQLNHPNTIAIYDYGRTPDGVFYYAMEFLDGITLEHLVTRYGTLPEGRVIHVLRQVCDSLAEAHSLGLIHRDVKPANVMLCHHGGVPDFVKVLDFGLVKPLAEEVALTARDVVVGTPLYMPPEAIENPNKLDARADIYALGAVGYFLLTGSPVFAGSSSLEVCHKHVKELPERPSERLKRVVAADLEAVILRCLTKRPEDRPATAQLLAEELGRCAAAETWTRRDAEAWWQTHRQGPLARGPTPPGLATSERPTRIARPDAPSREQPDAAPGRAPG